MNTVDQIKIFQDTDQAMTDAKISLADTMDILDIAYHIPIIEPDFYHHIQHRLTGIYYLKATFDWWICHGGDPFMVPDEILAKVKVQVATDLHNGPFTYFSAENVSTGTISRWTHNTGLYYRHKNIIQFHQPPVLGYTYQYNMIGYMYYGNKLYSLYQAECVGQQPMNVNKFDQHLSYIMDLMVNRQEIFLFNDQTEHLMLKDNVWYVDHKPVDKLTAMTAIIRYLYYGLYIDNVYYTNQPQWYKLDDKPQYQLDDINLTAVRLCGEYAIPGPQCWTSNYNDDEFIIQAMFRTCYCGTVDDKITDLLAKHNWNQSIKISSYNASDTDCPILLMNHSIEDNMNIQLRRQNINSPYYAEQFRTYSKLFRTYHNLYRGVSHDISAGDVYYDYGINSKTTDFDVAVRFSGGNIIYYPITTCLSVAHCSNHRESEFINWSVRYVIQPGYQTIIHKDYIFKIWTAEEYVVPLWYNICNEVRLNKNIISSMIDQADKGKYRLVLSMNNDIILTYIKNKIKSSYWDVNRWPPNSVKLRMTEIIFYLYNIPGQAEWIDLSLQYVYTANQIKN